MSRVVKFFLILLFMYHVHESPVVGQLLQHSRLFGEDTSFENLLPVPLQLPHRAISDIKEFKPVERLTSFLNQHNHNNKETTNEKTTSKKIITTTTIFPQIIKKHSDFEEIKSDCSESSGLSCDEQRKLIENVFGDVPESSVFKSVANTAQRGPKVTVNSETTTDNYESTTAEDVELSERFHDPTLVALMVGR